MPTYQHKCKNCGNEFSNFRSIKESLNANYVCTCGATAEMQEIVISTVTAIFKGSGWSGDGYTPKDPSKSTPKL